MKLLFLLLVLLNLALFAWQRGVFGALPDGGREPGRIASQIAPERARVLTPAEVQALQTKAGEARPAAAMANGNGPDLESAQACVEFGDFNSTEAARAQSRLAALELGNRMVSKPVEVTGWTLVFLPPLASRAEAETRAAALRAQGVKDLYVIGEASPLRNGISLGAFRDADAARAHLAVLEKLGVTGARVGERASTVPGVRFQLTGLDATAARALGAIRKDFPQQSVKACG